MRKLLAFVTSTTLFVLRLPFKENDYFFLDLKLIEVKLIILFRFNRNPFIHAIHGDLISVDSFNKVQFVLFIFDESTDNAYSCVKEKLAMIYGDFFTDWRYRICFGYISKLKPLNNKYHDSGCHC